MKKFLGVVEFIGGGALGAGLLLHLAFGITDLWVLAGAIATGVGGLFALFFAVNRRS